MNHTKQTVLHDPANGLHGNCLSAVLASLLHLPIDEVPLFIDPVTWVNDLNTWLRQFGLAYCMIEDFDCHIDAYGIEGLWHEVSGNTSRSKDVIHACVAKDGEMVFDPHPDDTGLTKVTCHGFFIALEPWKLAEQAKQEPVAWSVFVKHGRIFFSVGVQSFMLAYEPEDEPESSAGQNAEWMMTQLRAALSKLAAPVVQPDDLKDAARYRWLRERMDLKDVPIIRLRNDPNEEYDSEVDAAIDAAMAEKEQA